MSQYKELNENLELPSREPDHVSKRGIPYWFAPEWVRALNNGKTISRIVPLKVQSQFKGDEVDLHMVSKTGNLSYIRGSIQTEFKQWHADRQIDYILLGISEDELLKPDWLEETFQAKVTRLIGDRDISEIAQMLRVTRPTVERWVDGRNEPHDFMKPGIFLKLEE